MARKRYWVVPVSSAWAVKLDQQVLSNHYLKSEAIAAGQKLAKANQPSQLIVKRQDGTIEFEWTYGNDPYPPEG